MRHCSDRMTRFQDSLSQVEAALKNYIRRTASGVILAQYEVDDLYQMTAFTASQAYDPARHEPLQRFHRFANRCALHCVLNLSRKCSSQRRAPCRAVLPLSSQDGGRETYTFDPAHELHRLEAVLELTQALRLLTESDRWIIERSYFDGVLLTEISQVLGVSSSGAAKRLRRAVNRLSAVLILSRVNSRAHVSRRGRLCSGLQDEYM